jgi:pyroglutamyl-peptidase
MKKILITGFGAFLKHEVNPAEKVALALKKEGYDVVILPVSYEGAKAEFAKIANLHSYDLILSLGLASSRKYISLEQKAYNEMNAIHLDNDGVRKMGDAILPKQAKELATPFDLTKLQKALAEKSIPSDISTDPGRYICNEVYYLDLASGIPALFVHFPGLGQSSIEKDYLATETLLDALKAL